MPANPPPPEPVARAAEPGEALPSERASLATVVTLRDPSGVTLRGPSSEDIPGIVEASRDPETIRFTTVPTPIGGYGAADARDFLDLLADGWRAGTTVPFAIEAERDGAPAFCGLIDLRLDGAGGGSVGYSLHPAARGRSLMSRALRLVLDYAFDVLGLEVLSWQAHVGNWPSRRAAAAAGFRFEGTDRLGLVERGRRLDAWRASITRDDPRESLLNPRQPELTAGPLRLRPLLDADGPRLVEACADPQTRRWLPRLPQPYGVAEAAAFIADCREGEATARRLTWAVVAPEDVLLAVVSVVPDRAVPGLSEIGYWAHPQARGRGVVSTAVRSLAAWLGDAGGTPLIRTHRANRASIAVALRAGFTPLTTVADFVLLAPAGAGTTGAGPSAT